MDETNDTAVDAAVTPAGGALRIESPHGIGGSAEASRCPWCDAPLSEPSPGICEKCIPDALEAIRSRLSPL